MLVGYVKNRDFIEIVSPDLVTLVACCTYGCPPILHFYKRVSLKPPMRSASVPMAGAGRQDIGLDDPGQRFAGLIF